MRLGSWAGATNWISTHPGTSGSLTQQDSDWDLARRSESSAAAAAADKFYWRRNCCVESNFVFGLAGL